MNFESLFSHDIINGFPFDSTQKRVTKALAESEKAFCRSKCQKTFKH